MPLLLYLAGCLVMLALLTYPQAERLEGISATTLAVMALLLLALLLGLALWMVLRRTRG